jgi:hypothetical protein
LKLPEEKYRFTTRNVSTENAEKGNVKPGRSLFSDLSLCLLGVRQGGGI